MDKTASLEKVPVFTFSVGCDIRKTPKGRRYYVWRPKITGVLSGSGEGINNQDEIRFSNVPG